VSEAQARLFNVAEGLKLANPISSELSHMRPSLLPGLLNAVQRNSDRGAQNLALFELGNVFLAAEPGAQRFVGAGVRAGMAAPKNWQGRAAAVDAYQARADAQAALAACGVEASALQVLPPQSASYHPGRAGLLARNPKQPMAAFGEVHPAILQAFGIETPVVAFEVYPDTVPAPKGAASPARSALDLANLQSLRRDFAFEVETHVQAAQMVKAAKGADKNLISAVRVFDVFEGGNLAEGVKSIALEVTLQPREATLTEVDIETVTAKITAAVEKATGGKLRG
jgi:phenylalanyl-tRNA synthetase beta chain